MVVAQESPSEDVVTVDHLIERAYAEPSAAETGQGWSLAIDNDLFAPAQHDRDYTGGLAITVSGAQTANYWWSLDPLLQRIDRLVLPGERSRHSIVNHAVQVGLVSFTPQDLL